MTPLSLEEIHHYYVELGLLGSIGFVFVVIMIIGFFRLIKYSDAIIKQTNVLNNIYEALKPLTLVQARNLFLLVYEFDQLMMMEVYRDILKHNHIHDEGHESQTWERIIASVQTIYNKNVNTITNSKYSGKDLNKFMRDWWQEGAKVVYEELYHKNGVDYERTWNHINTFIENLRLETENLLNQE